MGVHEKLFQIILSGKQDKNILFNDLRNVLIILGFKERIKGDHFIYSRGDVVEILNIQPLGNRAKAYQVKQVRNIILKYQLGGRYNA